MCPPANAGFALPAPFALASSTLSSINYAVKRGDQTSSVEESSRKSCVLGPDTGHVSAEVTD
jgi:hypothetical protein